MHVCVLHTHASSTSRLRPIWFALKRLVELQRLGFKAGPGRAAPGQQRSLPTYTLIHGARPSASNSIDRPSWLLPKPPRLIPHFLSSIALEMGPALNIISPCALSLRLSLSRQREERSRGTESLFPLSSPLSKTTGSGSGFLEMSAFVCCVTAAALGRSSSDEVMHRLDEEAE